jgi:Ca2+/Na+ antiporter|nr:MAG TPA: hypothetical protein [Caudoviricetes sp.]
MKTWKLISGILSIVLAAFVLFQSMAVGLGNSLSENGETSGSAGFLVAILLIAAGITAIVVRKSVKKGAHIALVIMYGLAAITGFTMAGSYEDLKIWAAWCLICAILAVVAIFKSKKVVDEDN